MPAISLTASQTAQTTNAMRLSCSRQLFAYNLYGDDDDLFFADRRLMILSSYISPNEVILLFCGTCVLAHIILYCTYASVHQGKVEKW